MAEIKYVSQANLVKILGKIKATYVAQETGKGLSTNDLTNELLAKINGMGTVATLNEIGESNLSAALREKVNAASEGNHSHLNKELLDTYTQTEADLADAVAKKHSHANAEELAKIASGDKAKWDQAVTDIGTVKGDYLKGSDKTELQGNIDIVSGKVTTLIGDDANKSVRSIAAEEIAAQLIPGNAAESLNELTEIAAWIQSHPGDASAMNAAILALQKQLQGIDAGEGTVKKYVDDAIIALNIGDYAKASELTALAGRVTTAEGKITTLEGKAHTHENADVLAGITSGKVAAWDAAEGNAKGYADGLNTTMAGRVKAIEDDYVKASEMKAYTDAEIESIWTSAMA